jgi:hypothetical protein
MDIFIDKQLYPRNETPLLEHYRGYYDSVFIALLPFFRIQGKSYQDGSVQKSRQTSWQEIAAILDLPRKILQSTVEVYAYDNENYPSDKEIIEHGIVVPWTAMKDNSGFESIDAIYQALKTSIGSYKAEFRRPDLADQLKAFTRQEQIWNPVEGSFDPISKKRIYKSLEILGELDINVFNEIYETTTQFDLREVSLNEFEEKLGHNEKFIYAVDRSILFAIEWDSFFFVICSSRSNIDKIVEACGFEGFFCTEATDQWWEFPPEVLKR